MIQFGKPEATGTLPSPQGPGEGGRGIRPDFPGRAQRRAPYPQGWTRFGWRQGHAGDRCGRRVVGR